MLESALRRAPGQPQQTKPPYSPTLVEKGRTESADSHDTEEASIHGISVPISNSDSLLSSSPESMPGNQARRPQPDKSKLPAKTTDLSKYLEGAELTERQRECFSLKFEYGLRVSEIVIRLGLSRKTVDEHIAAAKRRIEWSQLKERQKANSARINPGD
jgi:DNA-binding CsgD family transcriptional regulator